MAGANNLLNTTLGHQAPQPSIPNIQLATRQLLACFANTFDPIESAIAHLLSLRLQAGPNPNFYNPYGPPNNDFANPAGFPDPTQVGAKRARYDGLQFDAPPQMDGFGGQGQPFGTNFSKQEFGAYGYGR